MIDFMVKEYKWVSIRVGNYFDLEGIYMLSNGGEGENYIINFVLII